MLSVTTATSQLSDRQIRDILRSVRRIAVVGASTNWKRPSFFVMKYLSQKGYQMLPVNPKAVGQILLGETVQAKLADVGPVDMVEVFRRGEEAPAIAKDAVRCGAKVLWLQIGVVSEEAREIAERNGLQVVMNRCPKIEYSRLWGELGWQGINTGVISSQRRRR